MLLSFRLYKNSILQSSWTSFFFFFETQHVSKMHLFYTKLWVIYFYCCIRFHHLKRPQFIPGDRHLSCFHGQMSLPSPFLCYLNGSDYMAEAIRLLGWNNKIARSKLSLASIFNRTYEYTFDHQAEGDSFNAEFCGRSTCLPLC